MSNLLRRAVRLGPGLLIVGVLGTSVALHHGGCVAGDVDTAELLKACAEAKYKFTPSVRNAFLKYAKSEARDDLKAQGKSLPTDFFAWIDSN